MRRLRVGFFVFSTWHATLLAFLLILGCKTKIYYPPENRLRLPYKVRGADDKAVIQLQKSLSRCGVSVITIGQDYLISIPSGALFPNQSPQLTWGSYGLLNNVVAFLKQFRKVAINITSYTGKYGSPKRELALTAARARAVADYLWMQGVDSRFIFTEGAGAEKPIMVHSDIGDKNLNSRIEITFRNAIV
ncbi:MAG: OmpA family protein [Tatlockia sp.]|nr:OmpA family protein [Tatlockia sp.]